MLTSSAVHSINISETSRRSIHYSVALVDAEAGVICLPCHDEPGLYEVVRRGGKRRDLIGLIHAPLSREYDLVNVRRLRAAIDKLLDLRVVRA